MNINHPTPEQLGALRRLWKEAFGDFDPFLDAFFSTAFDPQRCLAVNGADAACYWLDCTCDGRKIAYLYAVATAKECRGQGLCRALMEKAKQVTASQGYAGILLVPGSENLRQMYAKMGFENATAIHEFTLPAGRPQAPERLTVQQYCALRQALLPARAAVEGPELLAFLATQAAFYRLDATLCVAIREGNRLFMPELLGKAEHAAAIAASFGCESVTARAPGSEKKWAMYFPLTENAPTPTHFSLALD
jgi:GNAT superfamily N-acetyltransferase